MTTSVRSYHHYLSNMFFRTESKFGQSPLVMENTHFPFVQPTHTKTATVRITHNIQHEQPLK